MQVRSTSAARSVEASRRPLGVSLQRQLGEENILHARGLGNFNERGQSHSPTLGRCGLKFSFTFSAIHSPVIGSKVGAGKESLFVKKSPSTSHAISGWY